MSPTTWRLEGEHFGWRFADLPGGLIRAWDGHEVIEGTAEEVGRQLAERRRR